MEPEVFKKAQLVWTEIKSTEADIKQLTQEIERVSNKVAKDKVRIEFAVQPIVVLHLYKTEWSEVAHKALACLVERKDKLVQQFELL